MIDFEGLPLPEGSPEPGACIRVERPEEGLVVLVLDPPHCKLAVLDVPLLRDLDAVLDELKGDRTIKGIVITGREPLSFAAGADVDALAKVDDPELVLRIVRTGQELFTRISKLKPRTVAAVGGPVPGGAFELALACDRIVAADAPSTRIGLPETMLGIVPAWGGSTRLPRRVGLATALDAILSGRLFRARAAKKRGFVDRLTQPEYLLRIASELALKRISCPRPKRGLAGLFVDRNPLAARTIAAAARKQVLKKTRGHYPAPLAALEIVAAAANRSLKKSFAAEAEAAADLAVGPICKNLIGIFHMSEAAKKLKNLPDGTPAPIPERAGVLGAGVMGGTIASLFAEKGIAARLFDIAPAALDEAVVVHRKELAKKLKRRRLQKNEAAAAEDRFEVTRELEGFRRTSLVVEAVAERMDIKRKVLGQLAERLPDDAILATNTSSLSVNEIAEGLPHPERFVGMHFFNPVRKMPLVEIIRGERTSEETLARTAALALALGKTPVIVGDCAGFVVNRLLGPYLDEALRQFVGGLDPARIDDVAESFGMPMGPLKLLDEVGFDIATHAAASLLKAYGARMSPCTALEALVHEGRLGKKSGKGFYQHAASNGKRGAKPELATDLARFQAPTAASDLGNQDMLDRMLLPMLNEAAYAMSENVVGSPAELDLATVFGMGFPPFHGGLLRWADTLGASEAVKRLETIAVADDVRSRPDGQERFRPAPLLVEMARDGRSWYDGGA